MKSVEDYLVGRILDALSADPRVSKQDVTVEVRGNRVRVSGQTSTPERREAIARVVSEVAPGMVVVNELVVLEVGNPRAAEVIER